MGSLSWSEKNRKNWPISIARRRLSVLFHRKPQVHKLENRAPLKIESICQSFVKPAMPPEDTEAVTHLQPLALAVRPVMADGVGFLRDPHRG